MKRGELVLVRARGEFSGKPRPCVIVQSDLFTPTHQSVTLCPITSQPVAAPLFRVSITPTSANGLKQPSQVMVDKLFTSRREDIGGEIGSLAADSLLQINQALRLWLQL
ncbi:MAG: type II toxin-antitoxin system PemK/MazF family toxin [Chromatiales bacterium]|jgi:mRNA interferase MazF